MVPEPKNFEILEVVLAPKPGDVVPDPISDRADLEERITLSATAGLVPKIRASMINRLRIEDEQDERGEEERSYYWIVDLPALMVFISLQLHRELCHVAPQAFLDKRTLSERENMDRINDWLNLKVDQLLQKRSENKSD